MKSYSSFYFLLLTLIFSNIIFISCEDKKAEDEVEADGFTKEDRELLKKNEEKFNFNVEVTRMMDIIINSLYTLITSEKIKNLKLLLKQTEVQKPSQSQILV